MKDKEDHVVLVMVVGGCGYGWACLLACCSQFLQVALQRSVSEQIAGLLSLATPDPSADLGPSTRLENRCYSLTEQTSRIGSRPAWRCVQFHFKSAPFSPYLYGVAWRGVAWGGLGWRGVA